MRNDPEYLRGEQYRDDSRLNARATLHERFGTNPVDWHNWVFDQLDLPERCTVLEVGCGPGLLWRANVARIPSEWKITLSDFSRGMLGAARRALAGTPHCFSAALFSAALTPFASESFDAVIANHMLYHVPELGATLQELQRILRPGGRFYAATNGRNHMAEITLLMRRVDPALGYDAAELQQRFDLEGGRAALSAVFTDVGVLRHPDQLLVTETEPLVDYVLSTQPLTDSQRDHLRQLIDAEIAAKGAIRIAKDSGLFRARKA